MTREPREYFESKCESQLDFLTDELEDLEFLSENEGWDSDMESTREIAELKLRLAAAVKKMFQLKAASGLAWPQLKREMEQILYELGMSIKNMLTERTIPFAEKPHMEC
jgi:hypothetical protein